MDLLSGADNSPSTDLIKDGTEATFMVDVVEASQETPIIVDFWAPWCGPCKTLGPQLEEAVTAAKGAVKMVKINVDEAQMIASQMRVQSIPTVYAFHKGQPVDGFQGAVPGSEIKAFVDRVIEAAGGESPGGQLEDAVQAAEEMLAEGAAVDAAQTFAAILGEEPNHAAAYGGLVRAHIALGDLEQAEAILNGAPAEISTSAEVEAAHAQLELAKQAADAGPVGDLTAAVRLTRTTIRPGLIWHRRCTRMAMWKRLSISYWNCSAGIGNGTMARPRRSCSRSLMR